VPDPQPAGASGSITATLANYIASSATQALPDEVRERAKHHLIDTIAAMVSGSMLEARPGAIAFVRELSGRAQATVVGTDIVASAESAALANGMFAHADESDDSHGASVTHPGCSVVPASLAVGEMLGSSGEVFLRAIVAGYDVGTRVAAGIGGGDFMVHYHHCSFGGIFGSAAASAALLGLDTAGCARTLTFATHLASGSTCWVRDPAHIEKGFVFGGLPAHNGVKAALLARTGIPTSTEPLEGVPGLFAGYAQTAKPELATEAIGERFELMRTAIKKWCVGSPCQAALDSIENLLREHGFCADDVADIHVTLPERRVLIVNSAVPNLNLSHLLSLFIVDGGVTFESVHEMSRMNDPEILALRGRVRVEARPGAHRREHAIITLTLNDGRVFVKNPQTVRGQPEDPMTLDEVLFKAQGLIEPVLGAVQTRGLLNALMTIEALPDVGALRPLLQRTL
jgi:2-methylcitrate dehydratase PrpD